MNLKITVTQDHIDRGLRCQSKFCPIGLAVNEQYADETYLFFAGLEMIGRLPRGMLEADKEWNIPQKATKFIHDFDCGRPVQPFTFEATE